MIARTLVTLCLALFISMTAHAAIFNATVDAPHTVSVGTLNLYHYPVHYQDRVSAMKTEAATEGFPSIMGFQEAALWPGDRSLYTTFIENVEGNGYRETTNNYHVIKDGVGIGSQFKAIDYQSIPLPDTGKVSHQDAQFATFDTGIGPLLFVNIHTSPGPFKKSARVAQVKAMLAEITKRDTSMPAILVGDFNDDVTSDEIKYIESQGWVDALGNQGVTYDHHTNPYTVYPVTRRLDYIFYRPEQLKVVTAAIRFQQNVMSDHYGLSAVFEKAR